VGIDYPFIAIKIFTPKPINQLLAGPNPIGMVQKSFEQVKL